MTSYLSLRNKLLETRAIRKLFRALGIDSQQYRLLLDLFRTLGSRQEFMGTKLNLNKAVGFYFALSLLISLAVFARLPLQVYLLITLGYNMLLLFLVVVQDASNSLLNPAESSVLAHQPILGSTYVAAKLTHIFVLVAAFVFALNLAPAVAGLYLSGTRWYYPFSHLMAAFLAGLFIAFLVCSLCGWLFLFVAPAKLKNAAIWMQLIAFLAPVFLFRLVRFSLEERALAGVTAKAIGSSWMPWRWFVALGLLGHSRYPEFSAWEAGAGCMMTFVLMALGFRAFQKDYLINASTLVQGSARSTIRSSDWSSLGLFIGRLTGGQSGRGAFSFASIMLRRDWHFRRQIFPFILAVLMSLIGPIIKGAIASPFVQAQGFSLVYLIPQAFGFLSIVACSMVSYTAEPQGASLFIALPVGRLRPLARGVYLSLWIPIVGVPHLFLLVSCTWLWGVKDALLFIFFSLSLVSLYLSLMLLRIEGLPFANPFRVSVVSDMNVIIPIAIVLGAIISGLQWLLFHRVALVFGSAVMLSLLAFVTAHINLGKVESEFAKNLQLLACPPQTILKESE